METLEREVLKGVFVLVFPIIREYLREFSKKFKMAPMEYLGAWGTLIHEKNLKSKISCQTPFNLREAEKLSRIFPQTGIFRGFFYMYIIN